MNGVVYIGSEEGNFYAISEATRTVLWSRFLGVVPITTCGKGGEQGIISTATVATDPSTGVLTAYVNAPDGYLYALDAATGAVEWRGLVGIPSTTVNDYYAWGSPLVANGSVYIGISSQCDNPLVPAGLLEFNQATGAQVAWGTRCRPNPRAPSAAASGAVRRNWATVRSSRPPETTTALSSPTMRIRLWRSAVRR